MINPSIALQNGFQLLAEALDPKTMLVANINPKAPVRSALWTLGKQKHAHISARARNIFLFGWLTLKL
jgi:hypothetical protein